jgi:Cys-Gly metallodipeptidase DUG1
LKDDGWTTEPFELTHDEKTDRLYGRGSTDDKGPVLGWLNVIQAHQAAGIPFPVNLLMCFEGMEENGSEGLDDLIAQEAKNFFKDVDCVCVSDNYWLGTTKPCLTYGLRGVSYFEVSVSGPAKDLHSGLFGGTVHEPMTDLIFLMNSLVKPSGEILIPGINDQVALLTATEGSLYNDLVYSMSDFHDAVGNKTEIHSEPKNTLMHRFPVILA